MCTLSIVGFAGRSVVFMTGMTFPVAAFAVEFSEAFLSKNGAAVELQYFEQGSSILPGSYHVDIYLNQVLMLRQEIVFSAPEADGEVRPNITLGLLKGMGVDIARLQREHFIAADADEQSLIEVPSLANGASVEFDVTALALQISIPQAYIQRHSRGYVDPSLWDQGVTAFYTNYQTNFSRNINQGHRSDYHYVGLRNGFNLGAWRLRNESSIIGGTNMRTRFSSNRNYVERDLNRLKGKLALGELYTQGDIFDSVRFRGAQISSELGMLPDSQIGYAPVVRGIAETNATVEVSQNNYVIYSTTVPPGAFEISDIYPNGSNGDLKVKIIEADGREREYSQAYAYLPVMTRRGSARYSFAVGQYSTEGKVQPQFTQGTLVYGMSDNLTGYGGLLSAKDYKALNLGVGINSPWGGLSFDVTNSSSEAQPGKNNSGQSARFLYSKTLSQTDTTFTMVGYRYSTEGYRTLSQHVDDQVYVDGHDQGQQKSRFDLNINQSLAQRGSLFLSLGETSYWNRAGSTRRWQFGYSGNHGDTSYSFAVSQTQGQGNQQRADTQLTASISIPLGSSSRSARTYSSAISSSQGDSSVQSGVSGYVDEQNRINYSAQAGYSKLGGRSANLGVGWDTAKAKLSANYGQGQASKHMDLGTSGAVVVHGGGVTLSQPVGETFALIEVPGVAGVGVDSSSSISTDSRGYAVVPYVQPYRYNWLNLDTGRLGSDIEVTENTKMTVPTRGAITKSRFIAESGRRLQFDLRLEDGSKIPFGAQVRDGDSIVGVVDNFSRVLVLLTKDEGVMNVRWKDKACQANYKLSPKESTLTYERLDVICKS